MKKLYITTPIYYVNAKPHIGHAYTTVACDVFARFNRMLGMDVKFTTGTDEHGKKVEQSAIKAGISPQEFTDSISKLFRDLLPVLNISNDDFIRTTESRHKKTVQHFWEKLKNAGYIYLGEYSGWYDMRNEAYFAEDELVDGKSPLGGEVQYITEPCYFFKLSAFQNKLLDFYEKNPDFVYPTQRRNEMLSFIKQGLRDLAVSRTTFSWGIPVPDDPKHVVYVWLDALTNYLTLNGYPENEDQNNDEYWNNVIHFVGKEIVKFHAIYWVAFLMAVGIKPPKQVVSHGWWLSEGEKMSKSLGNVQDPYKYCRMFGSDALRYYLMREITFGADGNFSLDSFIHRYNSVLANSYGNLCSRVLAFIVKYCNGTVHRPQVTSAEDEEFINSVNNCIGAIVPLVQNYNFSKYLEKIEQAITLANQYMDAKKPWTLKLNNSNRMQDVLFILTATIYKITKYLYPVIPQATALLMNQLHMSCDMQLSDAEALPETIHIDSVTPLFPKIDAKNIDSQDVCAKD